MLEFHQQKPESNLDTLHTLQEHKEKCTTRSGFRSSEKYPSLSLIISSSGKWRLETMGHGSVRPFPGWPGFLVGAGEGWFIDIKRFSLGSYKKLY